MESAFHCDLCVPFTRPDRLWLPGDDHSIHACTRSQILANHLLVMLPVWTVHHPDAQVSKSSNAISVVVVRPLVEVYAWRKSYELVYSIRVVIVLELSQAKEHLCRAHRVPQVSHLGSACLLNDEVNHGWDVVFSHLRPTEVPSLFTLVRIARIVVAIACASVISQPHIVSQFKQLKWHR